MRFNRRHLITILAIIAVLTIVGTSVFVYMPIQVNIQGTTIPVHFDQGSNAGAPDLTGTIDVSLGQNKSSVVLTLHPTYQYTYYEDILRIVNDDTANSHYIAIRVKTTMTGLATAQMIIHLSTGDKTIDLNTLGTSNWYVISNGESAAVDFFFKINEGGQLPSGQIVIELIYSPNSSTPGSAPEHP